MDKKFIALQLLSMTCPFDLFYQEEKGKVDTTPKYAVSQRLKKTAKGAIIGECTLPRNMKINGKKVKNCTPEEISAYLENRS